MSARRKVWFVVARHGTHPERLEAEIGVRPDRTWFHDGHRALPDLRAFEGTWEIGAEGDRLDALIDNVLTRVRAHKDDLAPVCAHADTTSRLSIVHHDEAEFGLDVEDVALLAELNAVLDVGRA